MLYSFLALFISIALTAAELSFVFPSGENGILTGYFWEGTKKVYIRPRLQVINNNAKSQSVICGVHVIPQSDGESSFFAEVTDKKQGLFDLIYNEAATEINAETLYTLQAYDCSNPPIYSERVTIRIHVIAGGGPFFPQPSYTFTVSRRSYENTFVGQVQAISQHSTVEKGMDAAICGYQLSPPNSPFVIDNKGVIRIQRELEIRPNGKPFMLHVTAEDCHRPIPRSATVDVIIRQIAEGCQAGWTGLPTYLEYRGSANRPEKMLHPYKLGLEFCVYPCDQPEIRSRLELQSGVIGHKLELARAQTCLHDPDHLQAQRLICGIHPTTLNNFLPSPDQSVASQLSSQVLGSPPKLVAPTMVWRFNSSLRTVWLVDRTFLNAPVNTNAFDNDFTVSFWLRRNPRPPSNSDEEENVICSQDQQELSWRFMSIGLKNCQLIVRLLSSLQHGPASLDTEPRMSSVWSFEPLPIEGCSESTAEGFMWHHYAVTFERNPWATVSQPVTLLVDGREMGAPKETKFTVLPSFRPTDGKADSLITVGACFDPETHLSKEHVDADLAGLTVLIERAEAVNNLRCVAQCGESLIIPNVMKYLKSDVTVDMENHAITVIARNLSHIIELFQAIAYVRPQTGVSPGYSPNAIQARQLKLTASLSCENTVELPSHTIQMNIFPEKPQATTGSSWVPEHATEFSRSAIAQADMEKKASGSSLNAVSSDSPPPLLVDGSDIVLTEPPIRDPGIQIFADINFLLPDEVQNQDTITAADAVPLDTCLIWIASAGISSTVSKGEPNNSVNDDGHLEWSVKEITDSGLISVKDKHSVEFRGPKPAGNYEKLIKTVHYWPPKSVLDWNAETANRSVYTPVHRDVRFVAKIGLTCSSEAGKKRTPQFFVNVVVESADIAKIDLASDDAIRSLSPDDYHVPVNYAHSQRERQSVKAGSSRLAVRAAENESEGTVSKQHPSTNRLYVAIGLSVTIVLLVVAISLVIRLYVYQGDHHKSIQKPGRRKRFPAKPADFGGASLKQDPTLRLTANPIGELEYSGIGIVSEDLYGSCKNIAPTRHMFSPLLPQSQQQNLLWSNARLAGFDDFDEDYVEELSDGQFFNEPHTCSHSNSDSMTGYTQHSLEHSVVDVHDWIDKEDSLESNYVSDNRSDDKCKLVVTSTVDEAGSTVADL